MALKSIRKYLVKLVAFLCNKREINIFSIQNVIYLNLKREKESVHSIFILLKVEVGKTYLEFYDLFYSKDFYAIHK